MKLCLQSLFQQLDVLLVHIVCMVIRPYK